MKAAFLIESFKGGGVERNTLVLSGLLAARGHDILLITCRSNGRLMDRIDTGVRHVPLHPGRTVTGRFLALKSDPGGLLQLLLPVLMAKQPPKPIRYLSSLASCLDRERPDTLFAATPHMNLLAVWARRLSSASTRIILGERIQISHYLRQRPGWRHSRLLPLIHRVYPESDGIIAVSNGVADELATSAHIDRDSIDTVYNPVVVPSLQSRAKQPLEHPWFQPGEPPVILSVGRLSEQKDYPTLINAFARVHEKMPTRLVILGEAGNEKKTAQRQQALLAHAAGLGVARDLALPGFVSNPYPMMAKAGVFVLSSTYEGLPTVLIEAMACGCPVVSTDSPGAVEILGNGKWGGLAPIGDAASLAESILDTLQDAERGADRLRERADEFTGERAAVAYELLMAGTR
jgi:glycosyltransferase involved in cell wall biosynthesis